MPSPSLTLSTPSLPPSRWRQRLTAGLCAAAMLAAPLAPPARAQNNLPALGDAAAEDFGIGTERKLGDAIMREIRADPDYVDDPVLFEYLESVWQPLVAEARVLGNIGTDIDQRFAWEPFLVRDRSVNAFALPGGFVGVHLGMIAMTSTRDELASVLAHEMSHVTQRHIARSISASKTSSLIGLATLIVGVLAATRGGGADAANAAIVGGQAAAIQGQLNFSRDMEREADRVGFVVMSGAGFAPGGMAAMFEKLDQSSHLNDSGGYPYLRSHPLTTERIGEARARLGTVPPAAPVSVLEHTAAQARARVLMDPRVDALRRWEDLDHDHVASSLQDKLLNAYESGYAATLLHDWPRADASIALALGLVRGSPRSDARAVRAVVLMQAESLLARGDAAGALSALQPYATDGSRPVLLLATQATLRATPQTAADNASLKERAADLQTWVALHPNDSLAWGALSQVWGRLDQPLRAIRAEAESRNALGDVVGAIDRLRAGQRRSRSGGGSFDFIDASVIDARLRDMEVERKQLVADERERR